MKESVVLETLAIDFRVAFRSLRRRVGFALTCILVLAIGIGSVTVMYTALLGVVLRPLPYPDSDRLVWASAVTNTGRDNSISALDYFDYRSRCDAFSSLGAYQVWNPGRVFTGSEEPERVVSTSVSFNFFTTLGVEPLHGRWFLPEEEILDGPAVIALSYRLWQSRFAGDASVVGTSVIVDGIPYEVAAIMPASFDFPAAVDLWVPMKKGGQQESGRGNNNFFVFGRLADGASITEAQTQMASVAAELASTYPDIKTGWGVRLLPMHERFFAGIKPLMVMLMGATALLLFIACANLSALFLARIMARQNELSIRRSLGASSALIVRQLLTESLVLALFGGLAGVGLAFIGVNVLRIFAPSNLPRVDSIAIDGTVLLFALLATAVTAILFGITPALKGSQIELATALRGERGTTGSSKGLQLRGLLVAFQVALSVVLLIGAGLLIRSAQRLQHVDPGFDVSNRLTLDVQLPDFRYTDVQERSRVFGDLLKRLRGFPGVANAAAADQLPLFGGPWNRVHRADRPPASNDDRTPATRRIVTDGYFETLGIPLLAGREFRPGDSFSERPVVMISQALADKLFPGENAVGREMVLPWGSGITMEILGVAADVSDDGVVAESSPVFYLPYHQYGSTTAMRFVIATDREPTAMLPSVRAAVHEIEQDAPVFNEGTMAGWLGESLSNARFSTALLLAFAVIALVLAATGLYGVMSYFVAERTREIGIRVALGAGPAEIIQWILAKGAVMTAVGMVVGLVAAVAASGLISTLLYGTSPLDGATYFSVLVVLTLTTFLACLIPAKRALHTDPTDAMRS
jgi:putative ABC transport system permease protein